MMCGQDYFHFLLTLRPPSSPPAPLCRAPARDHCTTRERTEEGVSTAGLSCSEVPERRSGDQPPSPTAHHPTHGGLAQLNSQVPLSSPSKRIFPPKHCSSELYLPDASLPKALVIKLSSFGFHVISLSMTISTKGKLIAV